MSGVFEPEAGCVHFSYLHQKPEITVTDFMCRLK